jgi:hypothetical protein
MAENCNTNTKMTKLVTRETIKPDCNDDPIKHPPPIIIGEQQGMYQGFMNFSGGVKSRT